jgi:peptidoglycan hydrolase-like protein with peptidoglycan-binding domain
MRSKKGYCRIRTTLKKNVLTSCLVLILTLGIFVACGNIAKAETTPRQTVVLIIDKDFYDDATVKSKIDRYEQDNSNYNFDEILYQKSNNPVSSSTSEGGDVKGNSLEVRNTLMAMYQSDPTIIGVWVIGNIRPTIWRDASLWKSLGTSGFYPSLYPFVALSQEYYTESSFDVTNDGFYEKDGMTTGSNIGGGYNADIWAAVLIPPTVDVSTGKILVDQFFDRDHNYRTGSLRYGDALLYSDTFGCSSNEINALNANQKWQVTLLCPNFNSQLQGFNSAYHFIIDSQPAGYDPNQTGWNPLTASTPDEITEYSSWINTPLFDNSVLEPQTADASNTYEFYLVLQGRSLSTSTIENTIMSNLPPKLCDPSVRTCSVYIDEAGFREGVNNDVAPCPEGFTCSGGSETSTSTNGIPNIDIWNGTWFTYPTQQNSWTALWNQSLQSNSVQVAYLIAHGSPTSHNFGINTSGVENGGYSSLIYELESCDTGNYSVDNFIDGSYLYYGNALAVSGYSIPFVLESYTDGGYFEGPYTDRFNQIGSNDLVVSKLFLKNYENSIYFGDPLLTLSQPTISTPAPTQPTPTISFSSSGGSVSSAVLATLLAPSTSTTAYLNSLNIKTVPDCPSGFTCTPISSTTIPASSTIFTRNLTVGSTGSDVQALQKYLNDNGFIVASSGIGSVGHETTYFGTLTRVALIRFQKANDIVPSVGYFGPLTRGYIMTTKY